MSNGPCLIIIDPQSSRSTPLLQSLSHRFRVVAVPNVEHARKRIEGRKRKPDGLVLAMDQRGYLGPEIGAELRRILPEGAREKLLVVVYQGQEPRKSTKEERQRTMEKYGVNHIFADAFNPADVERYLVHHFKAELEEAAKRRMEGLHYDEVVPAGMSAMSARRDDYEPTWGDILTGEVNVDTLKSALSKDLVAPVEPTPERPLSWSEALRMRASFSTLVKLVKGEVKVGTAGGKS